MSVCPRRVAGRRSPRWRPPRPLVKVGNPRAGRGCSASSPTIEANGAPPRSPPVARSGPGTGASRGCAGAGRGRGFPRRLSAGGFPSRAARGSSAPASPRGNGCGLSGSPAPSPLAPAWTLPLQAAPLPGGAGGRRCGGGHVTPGGGAEAEAGAAAAAAAGRRGAGTAMSLREPSPGSGGTAVVVEAGEDAAAALLAEPDGAERCLSLLPWDRFSAWLHCVCVVGFDLELGQAVEVREAAGAARPRRGLAGAVCRRGRAALRRGPAGIGHFLWCRRCTAAGGSSAASGEKRDCAKPRRAAEGRERASAGPDGGCCGKQLSPSVR